MQILFYLLALIAIASALGVVFAKSPVYSVLALITTFFAIAGQYILLNAQFLAAVHIIVYAGAIMVLFLFVLMLLNLNKETEPQKSMSTKLTVVITSGLLLITFLGAFLKQQANGGTLATKQPAMTAAAFAAIIRDRKGGERLDVIVDYAACICHSQLAATIANVVVVATGAYAFDEVWQWVTGHSYLSRAEATYVFQALSPVNSGTVFYAALTGCILYLAALVGGWVDNWAVYHRLPQAIAEHRSGQRFGRLRMIRLAGVVSRNMSGWATNISLGLMLGMTPVLGKFFGLPLDVRHVTLNSGILSLATASLDVQWVGTGLLSLAILGVAVMFVLNLGVSFALSLVTAVRAYDLSRDDLRDLRRRLIHRLRTRPLDFIMPPRRTAQFVQP